MRHQSLTNLLTSMAQTPGMTAQDTLLAVTTLAFDIAALELFLPLTVGGTLVIASQDTVRDPQKLAAQLEQHNVTLMQATPATWRLLLESGWPGKAHLKLLCGGEALDLDLAQQLLNCGQELWNLYGPTETTIWSAALRIEPSTLQDGIVPIGKPIANTQFYVLDSQQRPVPIGVAGELYIGGLGLSPGYWNRDDLTAERFVKSPLSPVGAYGGMPNAGSLPHDRRVALGAEPCAPTGVVLYQSGDRVRYREDGTLEYLGRLDHQVKLRGYRIELGEIEAILAQHPDVSQAVAVLREDSLQEPQLVAYVVPNPKSKIQNPKFREHLAQRLPAYMVPSQFVVLDALPLTPNGKVDRKALPQRELIETAHSSTTPHTLTEELLANIWSAVLNQNSIGRDDNFFDLGGHSLLATRVVAQVRQAFGVELSVRSLFEHPTLAQLAGAIDALKAGDRLIYLQPIQTIERTGSLPLSDGQQRQWVLAQIEPGSPFYIIPVALQVTGALSINRLQQSLEQIVQRHEVLRTSFREIDGKAQPEIDADVEISIPCIDLTDLDEAYQQKQVHQYLRAAAQQPFDLSRAPLLRLQVLRLATQEHVVLLSLHHIIADGWSVGILVQELAQVYGALCAGRPLDLPPLPIQYVDYAAWQQQQVYQSHLDYWKQQLQGAPPLLELPTDYPRPAEQSLAGAVFEFQLSSEQTQALERFSQQQSVTLFMTLLAAFQVLLYRYSGFTDLAIGTPIANRPRTELEGLVGLFANTLVLRTDVSGNPRFEELLRRVRDVTLDAYAHQTVPFEQVVDGLEVSRSLSHGPLFQVMFVLQNAPLSTIALDRLAWQPLSLASGTAKFDLTLSVRPSEGGLKGTLEYCTALFEAETIWRMAEHLCTLLQAICEQPRSRIAELPLLTEAEQSQLWQWNRTQTNYPRHLCIHQLFEQQAEKAPGAIALIYHDQRFTYRELNVRANRLAWYLRSHAISPDTPIGLWAERCPDTLIAILAILKAGGAYMPLDPAYPQERLHWMVEDARLSLIVTSKPFDGCLDAAICQQIVLSTEAATISQQSSANLPSFTTPENLAYVLYTSGSTGQPKGVCVPHQGVVRLVKATDYVQFGADEVFLQAASLAFDASTFEIWGALLNGGQLVLMPTPCPSLEDLARAIAHHRITTLWLTAGLFHLMVDEQLDALKPVRQLLAGGDALSGTHIRKALAALKHTRLINGYGPTENTTFTCCHTITADSLNRPSSPNSPPIGRPIANTQVHILDSNLQPVPIGVSGELYIGGDGLARGYLNRPDLTAERFVPNPFVDFGLPILDFGIDTHAQYNPKSKIQNPKWNCLYKTGDRARYRPDGTLEFLGRLDNQVKIRGFRIELGEIEAALLSHPDIDQAIVNPWTDETGNQRLVAYFVKAEGRGQGGEKAEGRRQKGVKAEGRRQKAEDREVRSQESGVRSQESQKAEGENVECSALNSEFNSVQNPKSKIQNPTLLRSFLAKKLPDYMLPTAFIPLEVLPLTSNGKVDRRSLPTPVWESTVLETPPQTPVEQTLAEIWSAVLRLETVGVQDNFFELGGDSILALQMVSRAAQAGLSLSPRQIFQYQTIADLAAVAEATTAPAVEPTVETGRVPLTPIQNWFFEQGLANPHYFNQAVYLELPLGVDRDRLDRAIQQVVNRHDVLRLRFEQADTGWQQQFSEAAGVEPITWFDLSSLLEGDQAQAIEWLADELQASLHLEQGPLMRVGGFDLGRERPNRLLILMHHLVVDGLSWRILLEDMLLAYRQLDPQGLKIAPEEPLQLPPKTQSFKQWATWLQTAISQAEEALPYWQNLPQPSPLPLDQSPGENTVAAAETLTVALLPQHTQALLQTVPLAYKTEINDVLLTALMQVLANWTGRRSHLLTLENHGRHPEALGGELNLSRTVGWFTGLYPVELQLTGSETGDQLKAIKAQLRQVPHRGLSYGLLRYGVGSEGLAVQPQISFNYLGQFDGLMAEAAGFRLLATPGMTSDRRNERSHLIDINGWIRDGQLQMAWTYSRHHHHRSTLEQLTHEYLEALQRLVAHCQSTGYQEYCPGDFSLVQLDQATLEAVLGNVTFQGGAS
ncbi:MAG: amino acid adenylation domain-containing protein [Synechococcales bacterium]|nr:amino acid adenylation domain-containing protein [Synechococcales bacterium]